MEPRKLVLLPEELAAYVDTVIPEPPDTTENVPFVPGTTQQGDVPLEYRSCPNADETVKRHRSKISRRIGSLYAGWARQLAFT